MERLWLGELRRAHAIIHIISYTWVHMGSIRVHGLGVYMFKTQCLNENGTFLVVAFLVVAINNV
jgi:hypothetical protein